MRLIDPSTADPTAGPPVARSRPGAWRNECPARSEPRECNENQFDKQRSSSSAVEQLCPPQTGVANVHNSRDDEHREGRPRDCLIATPHAPREIPMVTHQRDDCCDRQLAANPDARSNDVHPEDKCGPGDAQHAVLQPDEGALPPEISLRSQVGCRRGRVPAWSRWPFRSDPRHRAR